MSDRRWLNHLVTAVLAVAILSAIGGLITIVHLVFSLW